MRYSEIPTEAIDDLTVSQYSVLYLNYVGKISQLAMDYQESQDSKIQDRLRQE